MTSQEEPILAGLASPEDIRGLSLTQLSRLAREVRELIISVVSTNGGHLAPSLGTVELTLALLKVFDPARDKIIWDVGHQAYAYKILTGRRDSFHTLRKRGGISGFPRPVESSFDHFAVGHSSTSISAGLGMAVARDILDTDQKVLSVIGDGSMTGGLAFEGLNQAGDLDRDLVVILNDNEMSISRNVGALSSFLSRNLSSRWMVRFKRDFESFMRQIPRIGDDILNYARKSEESLKNFFTPGILFEALKFNYIGPVDGHSITSLTRILEQTKSLEGPVLVHVLTRKGKGYKPAEENPTFYHGVGCFEPETGLARKKPGGECLPSYTDVFGRTLCELGEKDDSIVTITAAMPEGTGLGAFAERFPDRFFDVGICEQHAVTFAAGLATQGLKPVVAVYSTFLQRSYDQVVHDVCLQNLSVTLCLDRGGIVGEDGPTHHGNFDFSYLRHIPNMICMAPKDEAELQRMLATALEHPGPVSVRYPRGVGTGADLGEISPLDIGGSEVMKEGSHGVILAIGSRVYPALEAALEMEKDGLSLRVVNARFVKPLARQELRDAAAKYKGLLIVEENALAGGFGSAVLEFLADEDLLQGVRVKRLGIGDFFVEHGPPQELRQSLGLCKNGIKKAAMEFFQ